jgi:hypothetical protein
LRVPVRLELYSRYKGATPYKWFRFESSILRNDSVFLSPVSYIRTDSYSIFYVAEFAPICTISVPFTSWHSLVLGTSQCWDKYC